MRKTKLFGYATIVLLVTSMIVFLLAGAPGVATASDYENPEYLAWGFKTLLKLDEDKELISAELEEEDWKKWDWERIRELAKLEQNHIETALEEIDQFEVSPEMKPVKDELKLGLIDNKWAAHYLSKAADDYYSGDREGWEDSMEKVWDYSVTANRHMENSTEILHSLSGPTPKPVTPGFKAILAVIGLLAVAYLLIGRRLKYDG